DIYDVTTGTWTTANLSVPRSRLAATSMGNKIYFGGGINNIGVVSNVVDIYDVVSNTWTTDTLSQARQYLTAAATMGKVFFAGGTDAGLATGSNVVDIFDTATATWSIDSLTTGRYFCAATALGTQFLISGGLPDNSGFPINTVEIYTITSSGLAPIETSKTLSVYPNPASQKVVIKNNGFQPGDVINISDVMGKQVLSLKISKNETVADISSLSNGIYFVQLSSVSENFTSKSQKIIIQH
ncbi:MAG TPA: T9SS type A sorting domain-containing protein, partial [Bacteroidia bacterium]|nr:T9SS type A sorting domain-containing protein [Bacteroidia bacterium]